MKRRKSISSKWYNQGDTNIIPFVDVCLILLIVFMIGAPLAIESIEIEIPKVKQAKSLVAQDPIVINIDSEGRYYLGSNTLPLDIQTLRQAIEGLLQTRPDAIVYIRADTNVIYKYIADILSGLQEDGIEHYGLVTESF